MGASAFARLPTTVTVEISRRSGAEAGTTGASPGGGRFKVFVLDSKLQRFQIANLKWQISNLGFQTEK
jgi:hypothetical protein